MIFFTFDQRGNIEIQPDKNVLNYVPQRFGKRFKSWQKIFHAYVSFTKPRSIITLPDLFCPPIQVFSYGTRLSIG